MKEVSRLPLESLVHPDRESMYSRGEQLDREGVRAFLRTREPEVVIASVGRPLRWLTGDEVFAEWKGELAERVVDGPAFYLEDLPDERAYVATLWTYASGGCAVVFEQHH